VLSHGHYDHTGGLAALLRQRADLPCGACPAVVERRYRERDGRHEFSGPEPGVFACRRPGPGHYSADPSEILPGVWTVGRIRERKYPEGRGKGHAVQREGSAGRSYDDDLSLLVYGDRAGVVLRLLPRRIAQLPWRRCTRCSIAGRSLSWAAPT
jgi:7,8-dihydropterin-6-yl-methyl-4-(beta-D-ribofuranosyl)aminobenzene 5'-phosphate synthase